MNIDELEQERRDKRPQPLPACPEIGPPAKRNRVEYDVGSSLHDNEPPSLRAQGAPTTLWPGSEYLDTSNFGQYSPFPSFNQEGSPDSALVDMIAQTFSDPCRSEDIQMTTSGFDDVEIQERIGVLDASVAMYSSSHHESELCTTTSAIPDITVGALVEKETNSTHLDTTADLDGGTHGSNETWPANAFEPTISMAPEIDVCFGVVIVDITSPWMGKNGVTTTPVAMAPWGGRMRLSFEDSEAYAGILAHTVFSELQQQFNVKYSSNLVASTPPITATPEGGQGPSAPKNRRQKPPAKTPLSNDCTLRITVHGCKSQMQGVSKALSAVGFHFQHPYTTECRWGIEYWNPHYLLRPGGIMPKPQCPVDPEGGKQDGMTQADPLDEVETAEVMRIFDSAGRRDESIDTTQSPSLQSSLNPHQLVALSLMVERECGVAGTTKFPGLWTRTCDANGNLRYRHSITGSLELSPLPINGGILADEMGLGKTLTALALICASIDARSNSSPRDAHATLIVTPKSTIPEWKRQISKHIQPGHIRFVVYHGSVRSGQKNQLMEADIVLTTYETMRCKKDKKNDLLFSQTWRRVFLDEAHRICNASSITFQVARRLKAISRWCLTGTPIRNSLTDYFSLISFIRVPQFCEKSQFEFWIHSPIKKKQPQCFDALGDLIRATCIRRTKESCGLTLNLPSKTEVIEQVELDPDDQDLYNFFRDRTAKIAAGLSEDKTGQNRRVPGRKRGRNILTLINFLRRICNHGQEMLPPSALQSWREKDNNVDWGMMLLVGDSCEACGQCRQMPELQDEASPRADSKEPECLGCLSGVPSNGASKALQTTKGSKGTGAVAPSAKLRALLQNLRREQTPASIQTCQGKSVVFSIWTRMLDLVGEALSRDGLAFQRLDGQCTLQGREAAIKIFSDQPNCRVMLASIGSAGEGLNLIAGNHVHLLEPHWNPMAEIQALNRVHRMGQTREVTVRRYIVKDTIENYIQWVQQDKLKLISRSLDSADLSQEEFEGERWMRLQKMLKSSTDSDLALEMRKN